MKKLELVANSAGGLDLIVERDGGNPVRILTGKKSLQFFKELKKVCNTAIDTINEENGPGIDSDEFREWKERYVERFPSHGLDNEQLYQIFYPHIML